MEFTVGQEVERELDSVWFKARVTAFSPEGLYTLRYLDDGNEEQGVDPDEMRAVHGRGSASSSMRRVAPAVSAHCACCRVCVCVCVRVCIDACTCLGVWVWKCAVWFPPGFVEC